MRAPDVGSELSWAVEDAMPVLEPFGSALFVDVKKLLTNLLPESGNVP